MREDWLNRDYRLRDCNRKCKDRESSKPQDFVLDEMFTTPGLPTKGAGIARSMAT